MSHWLPANAYFDDPAAKLDGVAIEEALAFVLAGQAMHWVFDWTMRGDLKQRSLRFHLIILCACPQLLPCKYPSASWCARIHGVSRQWASRLQQKFTRELGEEIRFRGQRFKSRTSQERNPVRPKPTIAEAMAELNGK